MESDEEVGNEGEQCKLTQLRAQRRWLRMQWWARDSSEEIPKGKPHFRGVGGKLGPKISLVAVGPCSAAAVSQRDGLGDPSRPFHLTMH